MIDCDVHQNFGSIADLLPYLPEVYRDHVEHGGYGGISFPEYHWTHPEGFWRKGNVEVVCGRYGVPLVGEFTEFVKLLRERVGGRTICCT